MSDNEKIREYIRELWHEAGYTTEPVIRRSDMLAAARLHNLGLEYEAMRLCLLADISQYNAKREALAKQDEEHRRRHPDPVCTCGNKCCLVCNAIKREEQEAGR